ncbi:Glucose-6-phosphate/phosphate translocator 1 [Hibiscus syriacus]|uniref:Glucose-6-phosphate/phosphate translocator 1 n=1 Tax=Hibiscus syriacus TaxID=106335 RepID=A0A6A2YHL7_HIBSY|nr:Glucose-6-phosphate/phosphate translocator 1 [Hibiscus syriacus]
MSFSIKQSALATCMGVSNSFVHRRSQSTICRSSFSPDLVLQKDLKRTNLSVFKPLHVSSLEIIGKEKRPVIQCKAYEADKSQPIDAAAEGKIETVKRVKIGIYFATWWALNVVFNIYNKKVAVAHTIGHVAATVSMSKVAVSFTHIIKSGEPAFSVLVSSLLLGESFPPAVYLSLVPIIGGCALAAVTELNFNMTGFMGAMISNLAFVFRNIFSKKGMKGNSVSGMNYYACLSMLSLVILTPFAIAVEGPQLWAVGWEKALSEIGPPFIWWVAAQSIFYHLYNQVSYMSLDQISPLTFSIGNTMKRISVIVSSIIIFHTPVQPVNALGAAIAIFGTFLYSQGTGHVTYQFYWGSDVDTARAGTSLWYAGRHLLVVGGFK